MFENEKEHSEPRLHLEICQPSAVWFTQVAPRVLEQVYLGQVRIGLVTTGSVLFESVVFGSEVLGSVGI